MSKTLDMWIVSDQKGKELTDCTTVRRGPYEVDLFITEFGNLGITVYEPNKTGDDENAKSVDIFVDKNDLRVDSR